MLEWTLNSAWQGTAVEPLFCNLDQVFQLSATPITQDELSDVIRLEAAGRRFYVKRYTTAGKGLRRYLGKSRIRREWENLQYFHRLGLPAAQVVAYGEQRQGLRFIRGALITEELRDTTDMARLAHDQAPQLQDPRWLYSVLQQLADMASKLHAQRFIHTDFKWRNILVDSALEPRVFLIDCPSGYRWPKIFGQAPVARGIIKDLACLDKVARYHLSRSQRLRFYKWYQFGSRLDHKTRLSPAHKRQIGRILAFFEGRE